MLTVASLACEGIHADAELFSKNLFLLPFEDDDDPDSISSGYIIRQDLLGLSEKVTGQQDTLLIPQFQLIVNRWIRIWNQRVDSPGGNTDTQDLRTSLDNLLAESLDKDHVVDMGSLRLDDAFEDTEPWKALKAELDAIQPPPPLKLPITPPKPEYVDPQVSFLQAVTFQGRQIRREAGEEFDGKLAAWQRVCDRIDQVMAEKRADHDQQMQGFAKRKRDVEEKIAAQRAVHMAIQDSHNEQVNVFSVNYLSRQPEAVERYVGIILDRSHYPSGFPRGKRLEYNRDNQTLYLSVELPHPDWIFREGSRGTGDGGPAVTRAPLDDKEASQRYNDIVHKTLLRNLHEIFTGDSAHAVNAIQVSGWVHTLNKGNGQYEDVTIATLFCSREDFSGINLRQVDPTLCFRFLKGVSAPELRDLIPIPVPHQFSRKEDMESIAPKPLEPFDSQPNLAGLGIREFGKNLMDLFEKEFGLLPGDIQLAQDNPDGSMEAWGIDPEPIRGGKFVIQARKSNQLIPVAAAKELFGSMMHEGANKGILVTTSDFMSEVYDFVRNKPIILLNGSQLLSLFEKHGVPARISFREAIGLRSWLS
jgi:restriction system protein